MPRIHRRFRKSVRIGTEKGHDKINTTEDEDEDEDEGCFSFKKDLEGSHYFLRLFPTRLPRCDYSGIGKNVFFYRHFLYCSSCRYIALRVIRV